MGKKKSKLTKFLTKSTPLWMVVLITLNSSMAFALGEYYLMKKEFNKNLSKLAQTTKSPEELVNILKQEVLSAKGYITPLKWKSLGKQLVEAGAIDKQKYEAIFTSEGNGKEEMKHLEGESDDYMAINESNSRFMVNTLWALGLVQKSKVLDEGPMMQRGRAEAGNFASTGGWTLGSKGAMELYSSQEIILLTAQQQDLVKKIAEGVFRSCCGNSTAFPDCNHGMAALGYIEWAVYNGLSEGQIYKDLLAFNSFWFPQNYVEMAVYFAKQGTKWKEVDPKLALSVDYASAQGAQRIKQAVQGVPGIQSQGGGCGA
ncbi:MAG: hypothetical protein UU29_C0004G0016 [Candidatus Daviesbacteria bacterium GW2011_GWA2_40_9]|uniref:Uncharacterized protein n=1 Tax=Candidatus Daviesbacteria bacterium GW2011_GWA2_40_9 TaxID=1618424 RepID=A0A0G0WGQ7_9BACT|nr:MAG: hypothetical protein UU26_C0013G0027 [Candidatus Daviesbacteria bacterium GW2011_GWC1_40_9]KKR83515.1 MAG: hypothetical protein UU29_C0004G0016 [Candidatus Daviesbacteria bacterium GW2011_GWA2_40_9]